MAPIVAGILSVIKAIPAIAAVISSLSAMREKQVEKKVIQRYRQKKAVRDKLFKRLKETDDKKERLSLIRDIELIDPYADSV